MKNSEVTSSVTIHNQYEERIICYADILGWTNACNDLTNFKCVYATTEKIRNYANQFSALIKKAVKDPEHSSIEFSFFSDNFAVSAPVNYGHKVLEIMSWAYQELIREDFLVRGGVTIGCIYHRDGVIFGPALSEAVNMEEKEACFPRLLCNEKLVEHFKKTEYGTKYFLFDNDQKWVVNIATGSCHAENDLMAIIQRNRNKWVKFAKKWQYMEEILPRMYEDIHTNHFT